MDVLKKGKSKEWSKDVECDECLALLRVYKKDLYVVNTAIAYAGETWDPKIRADCAICKNELVIDEYVPDRIRNDLENAYRKKYRMR